MLSDWLRTALDATQMSQTALATELTNHLHRSIDRAAVNKMVKGTRDIAGDELLAIEEITGFEAPKTIKVPLRGRVSAGEGAIAFDDDNSELIEAPARARPTTIAVEVSGDSMFPAYDPGTILFYSENVPPEMRVNRRCIVRLVDGRMFVKILRRGSTDHTWTLQSINPNYPDMIDEVIEWVAKIDWTQPRY